MILCLDLGSRSGWASGWPPLQSGWWEHKRSRFEGGGIRYLKFRQWLVTLKAKLEGSGGKLEMVFFEEVRGHKGTDAAHVYGGLLAQLTVWCEEAGIPYQGVPVGTIKKNATGAGNSGKPLMKKAASKFASRQIEDDNEADAICLLWWAISSGAASGLTRTRVRVRVNQ